MGHTCLPPGRYPAVALTSPHALQCFLAGISPRHHSGGRALKSLRELRNIFEVLMFYLIVNQVTTEERATTLVRVLIASTTIMALYGLSQSFTYGIDFRVRGTMGSKMTFAGLLMLVDLMTLAQLLFRTHRRQLVWTIPALLLITAALLMTQTRSAWCGLIVGGCVLFGLRKKVYC